MIVHSSRVLHIIAWSACLVCCGCFVEQYEARLEKTVKLFSHDEQLNRNLANLWVGDGVSLRVPAQFTLIPPPAPEAPPKEGAAATRPAAKPLDPRQPDYLKFELPGLLGAWRADVGSSGGKAPAYLYVLGNQYLLKGDQPPNGPKHSEFHDKTIQQLAAALNIKLGENTDWQEGSFPRQDDFTNFIPRVDYRSVALDPARPIANRKTRFTAYCHKAGDIQLILLYVTPTDVDASERFSERIPLSLETLRAGRLSTSQAAGSSPTSGGAAPPARPSAGF